MAGGRLPQTITVDPKGRMVIPKDVRLSLSIDGKDATIVVGCYGEKCLQLYRTDVFDRISAAMTKLGSGPEAIKKRRDFKLCHAPVPVDSSGRFTIPDFLKGAAGVKDKMVAIDMDHRWELWDPKAIGIEVGDGDAPSGAIPEADSAVVSLAFEAGNDWLAEGSKENA